MLKQNYTNTSCYFGDESRATDSDILFTMQMFSRYCFYNYVSNLDMRIRSVTFFSEYRHSKGVLVLINIEENKDRYKINNWM